MAKRKTSHIRIETDEVQGEGSWAVIRRLNVKEMRKFRKTIAEAGEDYDTFEAGALLLKQNAVEWDWVDDEGEPLPNPKADPEVIELLTDAEAEVLGKAIRGTNDEDLKN